VTSRRIAIVVVLIAAAAAGIGVRYWWSQRAAGSDADLLPALRITTLDGEGHALDEWRGKVLLINFWATWCAPCMDELPLLVKTQAEFAARGLQIIGPAMDDADKVPPAIQRFGINYPVGDDPDEVDTAMRELGNDQGVLPYSVLVSRDGHIVRRILGGLHPAELREMLEKELKR
jgi:thiol-disulfide isomerase/thioredoxin